MAGYRGFSMSNNAMAAYEDGERPFSKWTKQAILNRVRELVEAGEADINFNMNNLKKVKAADLKSELLEYSSWHHTSSHFNKTDFYEVSIDKLEELTDDDVLKMVEKEAVKKTEPEVELWKCSFLEWSGSRRHPKATEHTEIGEVKGDWFFRKDGSKKRTTANGFKFIEKIEA
ncbi:MAG: hypothetical protein NC548_45440 [Lachnospiraceae bacterium]|nr:hypothetical protein [Lachnospiraceae bacterium]